MIQRTPPKLLATEHAIIIAVVADLEPQYTTGGRYA